LALLIIVHTNAATDLSLDVTVDYVMVKQLL